MTNIGPLPAPVLAVLRDPRNGINFNRVVDGGEWTAKLTTLMEGCGWIARCDLGSQMEVWPATDAPVTWPVLDQITYQRVPAEFLGLARSFRNEVRSADIQMDRALTTTASRCVRG